MADDEYLNGAQLAYVDVEVKVTKDAADLGAQIAGEFAEREAGNGNVTYTCLLYTSDAADE